MDRHDDHIGAFVDAIEGALVRLNASTDNTAIANALACAGPPAHAALGRRLADASTRGPMCRGIAQRDASADAKKALLAVPSSSRDDAACVDAVVKLAATDDDALEWLATTGEPGMLSAAGKNETVPCVRIQKAWGRALATRPVEIYRALEVALSAALARCTAELDPVLADAITKTPKTIALVVDAVDPYDAYGRNLRKTCDAITKTINQADSPKVRERGHDALEHGCKTP
jgi:hypothetical protein